MKSLTNNSVNVLRSGVGVPPIRSPLRGDRKVIGERASCWDRTLCDSCGAIHPVGT